MSGDDRDRKITGQLESAEQVTVTPFYRDKYQVWHCQLTPRSEASEDSGVAQRSDSAGTSRSVKVHVGEWFIGGLRTSMKITVTGRWHRRSGDAEGRGFFQADTVTDDQSKAWFAKGPVPANGTVEITGMVIHLVALQGQEGRIGYAFDVLEDDTNDVYTVLLRGRECRDVMREKNKVRVTAERDARGVVHAKRVTDLTVNDEVTVIGSPPKLRRWPSLLKAMIMVVFAALPWAALTATETTEQLFILFAAVWSLLCLALAGFLVWISFRIGHRI
ncbi:hypothetical protein [Actinoplanes aureus]|uniref:Uncharacterized protein n=1 Tax=Actinoplanes aureus TaxID=2792083 RepID=A0A931CF85_9ACTN|nr:hypothetical protein [Actinoplanes aureus]MBG0568790.1 hypothetical protein [Actinoplanes aureus]